MINLYKPIKVLYWVIIVILTVILFLIYRSLNFMNFFARLFLVLVIELLLVGVCGFVCTSIASKKYNKEVAILNQNCKVAEFIASQQKHMSKNIPLQTRHFIMLNLAVGHLYADNPDVAKDIIINIQPNQGNAKNVMTEFSIYTVLSSYHSRLGNYDLMKYAIDNMELILSREPKEKLRKYFSEIIERHKAVYRLKTGQFQGLEQCFINDFEKSGIFLVKVCAEYNLAKLYLSTGRMEEAVKAFEFVKENGGDTYMAKEAENFLRNGE